MRHRPAQPLRQPPRNSKSKSPAFLPKCLASPVLDSLACSSHLCPSPWLGGNVPFVPERSPRRILFCFGSQGWHVLLCMFRQPEVTCSAVFVNMADIAETNNRLLGVLLSTTVAGNSAGHSCIPPCSKSAIVRALVLIHPSHVTLDLFFILIPYS